MRLFDDDQIDLDDLVEKVGAGDAEVRRVAVMDLGDSSENAALPHLLGALQDADAGVRRQRTRSRPSIIPISSFRCLPLSLIRRRPCGSLLPTR